MSNLKHTTISRIAVCAALLMAPLMIYSAAFLVYGQIDQVNTTHSQNLQTKAPTKVSLSRTDSEQIAAAIALAYNN